MTGIAMDKKHILIIEDEENLRHMLSLMLSRQGYSVSTASNGALGLVCLRDNYFDFILCDIRMPEMDGKEFLLQALEQQVNSPVIMMSAYGSVDTAVECMKKGAYDFISKPFKKDEIVMVLKKAEERERLKEENRRLKSEASGRSDFFGIISQNSEMENIFSTIRKVADLKTSILILGESGTGKELVARAIHNSGKRREKPFVAVNCGAIPEQLLESELFGHVKGAFTDATCDKAGLFEQADGGTLFLDEIAEMPARLQVKLLRVLQEDEIRPVGASFSRKINVRVLSATSRNLETDAASGRFREDLFFRLNVLSIHLPPLRERVEDIPMLAAHFVTVFAEAMEREISMISPDTMRFLMSYSWPGNIRELENIIERSMILCETDKITTDCLPSALLPDASDYIEAAIDEDLSIKKAEQIMEQNLIRKALVRTGGNRTHAAKILEISHRSLLYKLKEFGIE